MGMRAVVRFGQQKGCLHLLNQSHTALRARDRPEAFGSKGTGAATPEHAADAGDQEDEGSAASDEDSDGLPPLERINNRRVVEYPVSGSESD